MLGRDRLPQTGLTFIVMGLTFNVKGKNSQAVNTAPHINKKKEA
jgi:hypothetical protein